MGHTVLHNLKNNQANKFRILNKIFRMDSLISLYIHSADDSEHMWHTTVGTTEQITLYFTVGLLVYLKTCLNLFRYKANARISSVTRRKSFQASSTFMDFGTSIFPLVELLFFYWSECVLKLSISFILNNRYALLHLKSTIIKIKYIWLLTYTCDPQVFTTPCIKKWRAD